MEISPSKQTHTPNERPHTSRYLNLKRQAPHHHHPSVALLATETCLSSWWHDPPKTHWWDLLKAPLAIRHTNLGVDKRKSTTLHRLQRRLELFDDGSELILRSLHDVWQQGATTRKKIALSDTTDGAFCSTLHSYYYSVLITPAKVPRYATIYRPSYMLPVNEISINDNDNNKNKNSYNFEFS